MVVWGLGVWVLGWVFWVSILVDEVEACGMAPSGFLDWGSLYEQYRRMILGIKLECHIPLNRLKCGASILYSEEGSDNYSKLLSQTEV